MKIEIWSDVVCPWCYIGKRRLEHALGEFEHADEVEIAWRSFQLNPDTPPGTAVPTKEYLVQRFGPQASQMTGRVAALGRDEGLDLNFDTSLTVNTLDAHRLLHLANWLECIRSRHTPNAPVEAGIGAASAAHLANIALRKNNSAAWNAVRS